jgi:Zn-dependent metalloprotease
MLGGSVMKTAAALRYMDDPKKDGMSINNYNDPHPDEPHALGGVFNRAFYLIATSPTWNTHKAFDIMVEANRHYWTASMKTLIDAACGVMSATKALKYNETDVQKAFDSVGIDVSKC